MSDSPSPIAAQLHLLGRAASQVVVHFGRHNIPATVRLDVPKGQPPALIIKMQCVPLPYILERWWAFPWQQHFHADIITDVFGEYHFTLWCKEHL